MRGVLLLVAAVVLAGCAMAPEVGKDGLGLHRATMSAQPGWVVMRYAQGSVPYWVEPEARLGSKDVERAEALFDESGQAVVLLVFNHAGRARLEQMTREAIDQPLAIVIDGQLRLAPLVQAPISDGHIVLSGFTGADEALQFAAALMPP